MFQYPIIKDPAHYPGQMGVPGSANPLGIRLLPTGNVLYVDANHADASDSNDGIDPNAPLLTIQQAIDNLANDGDMIVVMAGTYTENLDASDTQDDVTLIGVGQVIVTPSVAASLTLDLNKRWHVINIEFQIGSAIGVSLKTGADYSVFEDCTFNGGGDDNVTAGVDLYGAPGNITFLRCLFTNCEDSGGASGCFALTSTNQGSAEPNRIRIEGCWFVNNDQHIDGVAPNYWLVINNYFGSILATMAVDLSGGATGLEIVTGNYLSGDYSTAAYVSGTGGEWTGNVSQDTAEAEVGDNGWTIAVPVA